ncbi:type I toxin-antitoxin system SymE family toxin [Burkholderia humptydooensis]|uniref:Type I toxin-antitoxin system SymE family toxin n=2 Tax=Burkholderia humptydooensis TaxID=430531 RepID=A0A7T2U1D2_9BURK|nr:MULTISPECIES: SymE family type I addiction module toxin [Burkholderia]QPS43883.1 type I toxin-antitoxin system SymE family toxin [Burkholderia humptydooensis]
MADANHKAPKLVTERFVTIQQSIRHQSFRPHTTYRFKQPTFYPWLKLAGRWIEAAGFLPGQRVRITVEQRRLVITAE